MNVEYLYCPYCSYEMLEGGNLDTAINAMAAACNILHSQKGSHE